MKILICGPDGHGKSTLGAFMAPGAFANSSEYLFEKAIWPALGPHGTGQFEERQACIDLKDNYRHSWKKAIYEYLADDPAKAVREFFSPQITARRAYELAGVACYVGVRSAAEFYAAKEEGLFNYSIWIENERVHRPSNPLAGDVCGQDCNITLKNDSGLFELGAKAASLMEVLHKTLDPRRASVGEVVTEWADRAFPNRTITNALQKMVFEEIPEFMLNQSDTSELADIGILLYDIAQMSGVNLETAMREKMVINNLRKWEVNPVTGLMSHIKESK